MTEPVLATHGLSVGWPARPLIEQLDLTLQSGERVAVVGANGSGKSTLLRTLLGLIPALAGKIVRRPNLRLTYLPQELDFSADAPLTVAEYLAWAAIRRDHGRPAARSEVRALLEARGLDRLAMRRLASLSPGERQRVQFARILVAPVDLVALDEPTAAMDSRAEARALDELDAIVRNTQATVLFVTHSLEAARAHADRLLIVNPETRRATCIPTSDPEITEWLNRSLQ